MQLIYSHNWFVGNDITPPMFQRDISLYTKYPDLKGSYQTMLGPFNFSVWMAVLATIISTAVALVVQTKSLGENNDSWFDLIVPSYSVLISESMPYNVMYVQMSVSKWTLLSFLIPISTLLSHAYRSNLLASLIKQEHEKPVDTYQDLIERDMTIYIINGTTVPPLLANSPNPTVVQAYRNNLVGKGGFYSKVKGETPSSVLNDIYAGKGALIEPRERKQLYLRRGKELNVGSFICGYYLSMGHPLKEKIKGTVERLVESGIFQSLVDRSVWIFQAHLRNVVRIKALKEDKWKKLENSHVMPVYLMSAALVALSCLVFMADLYKYISNHKDQAKQIKTHKHTILYIAKAK